MNKNLNLGIQESDLGHQLMAVIDTAIDGIITIDSKGIVESINPAGAKMFGYLPMDVIGKNVNILMPEPDHSAHNGYIERYQRTKKPHIIGVGREVTALRKDGTTFPFRLAISEVVLNDRIIFTGIVHDLSEVKEAEKKLTLVNEQLEEIVEKRTNELEEVVNRLLSTNRRLESNDKRLREALEKEIELNELKSRFVSMASHEFRTPLSTILSSAAIISRYTKEAQDNNRQKHIKRIKSAVSNLTGILNDFLSLSKLEEGKVQLSLMENNISELCEQIKEEVQGLLKDGQIIEHEHIGPEMYKSDVRILKNILFNLISNGIKYSKAETTIKCQSEINESNLIISIVDEGIGIPEPEQKYLFNRFFRASNVEMTQGTGLGLNIVKEYVDLLNGTISFHSIEGKGTTFTVSVPIS